MSPLIELIEASIYDRARRVPAATAARDPTNDIASLKLSKARDGRCQSARRAIGEFLTRIAAKQGHPNHAPEQHEIDEFSARLCERHDFALYMKEQCYFWAPGNVVLAMRTPEFTADFEAQQEVHFPKTPAGNSKTKRIYRRQKAATPMAALRRSERERDALQDHDIQTTIKFAAAQTEQRVTTAVLDAVLPTVRKAIERADQLTARVFALETQNTALQNRINLSEHSKAVQSRVAYTMSTLGIQPTPARVLKPRADISPEEAAETSKGYFERLPEAPWEIEYISDDMLYLIPAEIAHLIPKERAHFGQVPMYARAEAFAPTQEAYDIDPEYAHLPIGPAPEYQRAVPETEEMKQGYKNMVSALSTAVLVPTAPLPAPQSPELAPAFTSVEDIFAFMNETPTQ